MSSVAAVPAGAGATRVIGGEEPAPPARDALLTAWLTLPVDRSRALRTLHAWADRPAAEQAVAGDDGAVREIAGALVVMLVAELRRWGAPWRDVGPLVDGVDRALEMILHSDHDHDGLAECGSSRAAVMEVQGLVYGAFRARARLARELGEVDQAGCWQDAADGIRFRFNEAFWDAGTRTFAPALDADKRRVGGCGLGIAPCLWTGIVEPQNARAAVAQLMAGRTGARVGAVEDAVLAAGLMRYGFVDDALRVMDRAVRAPAGAGVAAATDLHLRTMLRLEPDLPAGVVHLAPVVPEACLPLLVEGVRIGGDRATIKVLPSPSGQVAEVTGLPPSLTLAP